MLYIIGMVVAFAVGIYAGLGYPGLRKRVDPSRVRRVRPRNVVPINFSRHRRR